MDSSFGHHYDASDLNRGGNTSPHDDPMSGMSPDFGDNSMYGDNRMFDPNPQRHGSLQTAQQGPMSPSQYSHTSHNPASLQRRQSMPEFNGANGARMSGNLQNFQFNPNAGAQTIMIPGMLQTGENGQGRPMNLITQYISGSGQPFQTMISPVQATFGNNQQMNMANMNMQQMQQIPIMDMSQMNHQNNNNSSNSNNTNTNNNNSNNMGKGMQQFIPNNNMMNSVMLQVPHLSMPNNQGNSPQDHNSQHDNPQQTSPIHPSPLHQTAQDQMSSMSLNTPTQLRPQGSYNSQNSMSPMPNMGRDGMSYTPQSRSQFPLRQDQQNYLMQNPGGQQSMDTMTVRPSPHQGNYLNAYSSTGFDMLNVLVRVATRPDPEINIGAVDLSCAFVVCDALEHDFPIIYCSENFERLTGYTKHEILGRNCRFLQAPDGKVRAGVKRSYVDDDSVLYLKNRITARKEAQVSLINYRKGGQPFMNLLTMIPVSFDDGDVRYFVGFQVDLVEQPGSVTNKNKDGTYTVNYQRGLNMPRYVYQGQENVPQLESGQTVSRDDVSTVLTTIGSGESDLSRRIWDKVLLENTDDVVFVLSLKGLFLYLSPSSKRILEYEPQQLVGTALSSVCHPSDIVPVTRELKDTSNSTTVNVVFRIRRKESGYMWFEGYGSLHTEQGKGRKSIVLVGRERPVYSVSVADIQASGGIGENEVWTKLSTSGMFLFVSSSIRALVDRTPEELVGTSIQILMRTESRKEFSRVLEVARGGRRASVKHELLNKRGQVLQAVSTVYPGDATEGSKPTFFVAQTRLVKYTRTSGGASQRSNTQVVKLERDSTGSMTGKSASPAGSGGGHNSRSISGGLSSHASLPSPARFLSVHENATTYAGGDGLSLGHQDQALASELNLFDELKTTRSTSWQFELRQMEKRNRLLAEELQGLLAARKKRKRRKGAGMVERDCANCHTKTTPEWRRGPSGNRDLCNSCGLRWAKQQGRISPRTSSQRSTHSDGKQSGSPLNNNSNVHGANAGNTPTHNNNNNSNSNSNDRRKSSGPMESRSIDETLAETNQPIGQEVGDIGASSHVSKSAKIGGAGDSNSRATKVENSQDDSTG